MLKPESKQNLPAMSIEERGKFRRAVAEEAATKNENVAAARVVAAKLKMERKVISDLVARLRVARETAGVSLNELESRTGIQKSSLSRLENSIAPNPTILTLHRYATAIRFSLEHVVVGDSHKTGTT